MESLPFYIMAPNQKQQPGIVGECMNTVNIAKNILDGGFNLSEKC